MKVLVVGSGAREHAIVHALRRSPSVAEVFAAPGNPGIAAAADVLPIAADEIASLAEAAEDLHIDLTVVGPELPLAMGIGDEFAKRGLRLFGPNRAAAEIEASKVFAKEFCLRHGIPTAASRVVETEDEARKAVSNMGLPIVLKADGLAAGKGVIIVTTNDELDEAMHVYFSEKRFGSAGRRVLVEELLTGEELSYMVVSDGTRFVPLATSHDYKRAHDGNRGPNTGGMGSHSPAVLPAGSGRAVLEDIVRPALAGMAAEGRPYRGVLYVGVMMTAAGPKVLEFNCRLGDPETQSILLRLEDDLGLILKTAADGQLVTRNASWRREAVACVVLASKGYPGAVHRGVPIVGIEEALAQKRVVVYQAATAAGSDGRLLTAGGRVLSVCGRGATLADAVETAYRGVACIHFDGMQFRTDIGADTLQHMETP